MEPDPFDDILGLEDKFYDEGYQLGITDGSKAGRIEGRVFGLEKGFEKYVEMARLHGRTLVWNCRLPSMQKPALTSADSTTMYISNGAQLPASPSTSDQQRLPSLPDNPRLEKHLRVLYALTEPASLSTQNTEEAVSDFDDRLKRAHGKIKIIERIGGMDAAVLSGGDATKAKTGESNDNNIEDVNILKARH